MGVAFTAIVHSLVNDIIMPPIGWAMGGVDFTDYFINLSGGDYASLAEAKEAGAATINIGVFVNTIINFLIVSFAIFILVKQVNRFRRKPESKPAVPPRQEVLLEEIRDLLKNRPA
jgi:large conductance mechanosensitive channel